MNKERYVNLFEDLFSKSDKVIKSDCKSKLQESIGVFNPYSSVKVIWDLVGMLFIFIQMITIPLIITFSIELDLFYDVCNQIMNYFFLVDIVISFNTGYYCKYALHYNRGALVTSHSQVIKNYFTTWFFVDLISSFPFDLVVVAFQDSNSNQKNSQLMNIMRVLRFLKILRLIRAFKLKRTFTILEDSLIMKNTITIQLLAFLKIFTLILSLAHWLACIWNIVRQLEGADDNWYSRYQKFQLDNYVVYMNTNHWIDQYLVGIYFSVTTMITIGYGDIYPTTTMERLCGIFVIVFSSGVFGYIMSSIVLLFANQDEQNFTEKSNTVLIYLKQKKVSKNLQVRIKGYIDWLQQQEQIQRNYEQQTLSNLSKNLHIEVMKIVHGKIMQTCLCFCNNFSFVLLEKLAYHFKEKIYSPEDTILSDGDMEDACLFYIINGSVTIQNINVQLNSKQYFGEIGFFANVPRSATIKANTFINVLILQREKFVSLLSTEDLEKYFEIKFQIEIEQNLSLLHIKCYLCEELNHIASKCPYTHYVISKYKRIKIVQKFQTQFRTRRKHRKKQKSLKLLNDQGFMVARLKIEKEMLNIEYFLGKKQQMIKHQLIQKMQRKPKVRDSFIGESYKEFIRFTPAANLGTVLRLVNNNADEYIKVLEGKREEEKQKRLKENADKFLKMLQAKKNKKLQVQKKNRLSIDNVVRMVQKDLLFRKPSEENRRRLCQVQDKRIKQQKSYNSFESGGKIYLTFPAIPEDAIESPVQELKRLTIKAPTHISQVHIEDPQMHKQKRPQSEEKRIPKSSQFYSTSCLENMIYVVINHHLQK